VPKRNPTTEPASSATRATNDPIFPNMAPGVPRRAAVYAGGATRTQRWSHSRARIQSGIATGGW